MKRNIRTSESLSLALLCLILLSACSGAGTQSTSDSSGLGPMVLGPLEADPGKDRNRIPSTPELDISYEHSFTTPIARCVDAAAYSGLSVGHSFVAQLEATAGVIEPGVAPYWVEPTQVEQFDFQETLVEFANDPLQWFHENAPGWSAPTTHPAARNLVGFCRNLPEPGETCGESFTSIPDGPNTCFLRLDVRVIQEEGGYINQVDLLGINVAICSPDPECPHS